MITRVLIINRQLVFAVTIKQALEQTGAFEVHPFTDPNAAVEYLRTHPHDVALVDFDITVMQGPDIVDLLRKIQPDIAIIASPAQPHDTIVDLNIQDSVDAPFSARGIIPVIERAAQQMTQPSSALTRNFAPPDEPTNDDTDILPAELHEDTLAMGDGVETNILDDDEPEAEMPSPDQWMLELGVEREEPVDDEVTDPSDYDDWFRMERASDGDDETTPPPSLPEFSTLDKVLDDEAPSSLYEPPVAEGDTPSVPDVEDQPTFESVLSTLPDEEGTVPPDEAPSSSSDFDSLVNSMRADMQHTPLPDRHQQFVELILTGGMDGLISELEKTTDELDENDVPPPPPPATSFERLAEEEPPMPTLEESGTVGDLMVGVSDTSFRNVLEMMRGREVTGEPPEEPDASSRKDAEEAFAAFFEQQVAAPVDTDDDDEQPTVPAVPEKPGDAIPAQLILETALDQSTPVDAFSINSIMDDIERQLTEHKPDVVPLPSWDIQSFKPQPRRRKGQEDEDRYVKEPDFLSRVQPEHPAASLFDQMDDLSDEELSLLSQDLFDEVEQMKAIQRRQQQEQAEAAELDFDPEELLTHPLPSVHEQYEEEETVEDSPVPDETEAAPAEELATLDEDDDVFTQETVVGAAAREPVEPEPEEQPGQVTDVFEDEGWAADDWDTAASEWDMAASETEQEETPALEDDWAFTIDEAPGEQTVPVARPHLEQARIDLGPAADFEPQLESFEMVEQDDPRIAQIALSLTQMSLELAAEATLLTTEEEIVAFAGQLDQIDIDEIRDAIADDWDANPDQARVRFITLPSSGKDYMLYSRKTAGDFTLSMIFAGTTPLRDIRRQGKRLVDALEHVPEITAQEGTASLAVVTDEVESVEPVDVEMQPYTYLWLLRDSSAAFNEGLARIITAGLNMQLSELGWQVQALRAHDQHVYIHADVPGEQPAYEVIEDLKRRTAEIIRAQEPAFAQSDTLWADSYLVMMPGRELDSDEIDQFINFERML